MPDYSSGQYKDHYLYGKMTRSIAGDAGRYIEEDALSSIYLDENLGVSYQKWHYIVLSTFYPDWKQQEAIDILLLAYEKKIDIDNWKPWLLYIGRRTTSISKYISGLTNITKIAFMKQKKLESPGSDYDEDIKFI